MGTSTDALLIYGYVWEDEADLLPDPAEEWEVTLLKRRGMANPWAGYPGDRPRPEIDAWLAEHKPEFDAWRAAKEAIAQEYGVGIDRHGSDQWEVPVVTIASARKRAARGYPEALTEADLAVGEDWDARLARFCADLGIDTSGVRGPGWFLVSWWG